MSIFIFVLTAVVVFVITEDNLEVHGTLAP